MSQGAREHEFCGGKYRVSHHDNGILTVCRNGVEWPAGDRSLCGDGLSLAMIQRIEALEDRAEKVAHILCEETEDAGGTINKALNIIYRELEA